MTTPMYSNKSSSIISQGIFQLRQMCQYLEWELNVDLVTLNEFEEMIRKDFPGIAHAQLTYILPSTKKSPPLLPSVIPFYPTCSISPLPSNKQRYMSPLKVPYVPSPPPCITTRDPSLSYSPSLPASSASSSTPLIPRTSQPRLSRLRHR